MTAHNSLDTESAASPAESGPVAQLCAIIGLVEEIAGSAAPVPGDAAIEAAYDRAPAIARRRFDTLSREAVRIATAGVEALVEGGGSPQAAAELGASLRHTVARLERIVG